MNTVHAEGNKQAPPGVQSSNANNYLRADGQNCGNFLTERPSSNVHAAPGGGSSLGYLFGDGKNWFSTWKCSHPSCSGRTFKLQKLLQILSETKKFVCNCVMSSYCSFPCLFCMNCHWQGVAKAIQLLHLLRKFVSCSCFYFNLWRVMKCSN